MRGGGGGGFKYSKGADCSRSSLCSPGLVWNLRDSSELPYLGFHRHLTVSGFVLGTDNVIYIYTKMNAHMSISNERVGESLQLVGIT